MTSRRIVTAALIILLFGLSCVDVPKAERNEEQKLIGTWKLTYSNSSFDWEFMDSSWIEFRKGDSFQSNRSFFWAHDSLRYQPKSGSYSIYMQSDPLNLSRGECCSTFLVLTVDSVAKSWVYSRDSLHIYWSSNPYSPRQYTWTRVQ